MPALPEPQFATDIPDMARVAMTEMKKSHVSQPEDRHTTRMRDLPFLMDGDFLQVTNDDHARRIGDDDSRWIDGTWDFQWGGKHYVVRPGETKFVAFEALVNEMGDPRSVENTLTKYNDGNGNVGVIMDRYSEISRLFARYAVQNEDINALVDRAPKVRITTLNGEPVRFVTQKPDAIPYPVPLVDPTRVNSDAARMNQMREDENAELRERLEALERKYEAEINRRAGVDAESS